MGLFKHCFGDLVEEDQILIKKHLRAITKHINKEVLMSEQLNEYL